MSLQEELEWEPVDTRAVESAEARELRERETRWDIQRSKAGARDDTRPVGAFMPETREVFRAMLSTGNDTHAV